MKRFIGTVCAAALLLLLLSACSMGGGSLAQPEGSQPAISGGPTEQAEQAEQTEAPPEDTPLPARDELWGEYYNDYLDLLLSLDGRGGFTLSGSESCSGSYSLGEDGLIFEINGREEPAAMDADGDILFECYTGYFLSDFEKWGISDAETGK